MYIIDLKKELNSILDKVEADYHGLFANELRDFIAKVNVFGYHFASLDIRQDSRIIHGTLNAVLEVQPSLKPDNFDDLQEHEQLQWGSSCLAI